MNHAFNVLFVKYHWINSKLVFSKAFKFYVDKIITSKTITITIDLSHESIIVDILETSVLSVVDIFNQVIGFVEHVNMFIILLVLLAIHAKDNCLLEKNLHCKVVMSYVKRISSIQMRITMVKIRVGGWINRLNKHSNFSSFIDAKQGKAKRVRTTFTEEQLQILQANFEVDSNPDGQDLERIAQITGITLLL